MSKGTRKYPIRIPDDLAKEIEEAISSRNYHSKEAGWTFSDFVRKALREKIAHGKRSRAKKLDKMAEELVAKERGVE